MRLFARAGLAAGVLTVAVGVAGCGGNGSLLSSGAATQLSSDLTQASSALEQYNCPAADSALTNFRNDVSELQGVNATLVSMLSQGASTIASLAAARCPTGNPTATSTRTTTTSTHTTTTATQTNSTTTATTTATDTTPITTTTDTTSTTGGQPFGTVTTTPEGTVSTASTPTASVPATGGAGLGSTGATGGTGVGGGGAQ